MLTYIKEEANKTTTQNGAQTYLSTGSDCLDLFATIGALRSASDSEIRERFARAYFENKDLAMKILFFARDARGGLGERRVFRTILSWLAINEPQSVIKNISYISEYGRYDDLLCLLGTRCEKETLDLISNQITEDLTNLLENKNVSLLAKWMPSINASSAQTIQKARVIANAMGISARYYRQMLSTLREYIGILENNLRMRDYSFDYEKQPSRAMFKYRGAFARNDSARYWKFVEDVAAGKKQLHTDHVMPYELVEPYLGFSWSYGYDKMVMTDEQKAILNATWNALPDYGGDEDILPVIDTSGSMYDIFCTPMPAAVALSLGLYFAQRNKGMFRNHFIEFSRNAQLIEIKGETFADKLQYVSTFSEVANTNIEVVFDLILNTAINNNLGQKDLPSKLVFISDMEFDECTDNADMTNFENAKAKFEAHGLKLPQIVFWNVYSSSRQQPVTQNAQGVILVSGVTPRIFEMVAGDHLDPYAFMMEVVGSERYERIAA